MGGKAEGKINVEFEDKDVAGMTDGKEIVESQYKGSVAGAVVVAVAAKHVTESVTLVFFPGFRDDCFWCGQCFDLGSILSPSFDLLVSNISRPSCLALFICSLCFFPFRSAQDGLVPPAFEPHSSLPSLPSRMHNFRFVHLGSFSRRKSSKNKPTGIFFYRYFHLTSTAGILRDMLVKWKR